jgi:SAM-dependent methyltransferase
VRTSAGSTTVIPDYESYDYSTVWRGRTIEDRVERAVVSNWAKGETGIELGGGFGRITQAIEERIPHTFMLDYSLANLRRASKRLRRTTLVRATLDRLPFDDDSFDFVALIRVIQHIPDPDALLDEVVRIGRQDGTFVLGFVVRRYTGGWEQADSYRVTPEGHRVYPTPLRRFRHPGLERVEILGVGAFDNAIGRRAARLWPLAALDLRTSRLWPAKPMLFVRYRIRKRAGKNEPHVLCKCGGSIDGRSCNRCGRPYGRIIDIVQETAEPANP